MVPETARVLADITNGEGTAAGAPPPKEGAAGPDEAAASEATALHARIKQLELAQGLMERELESVSAHATDCNAQLRCGHP